MTVTKKGDYEWTVTTDEKHVIPVDSKLVSAEWEKSVAYCGQKAYFLIYTAFLGKGSALTITLKTSSGQTLDNVEKKISNNYLRDAFDVPDKIDPDEKIYFEVMSEANNLNGQSVPILVDRSPVVKNLKWSQDEVEDGDEVTLSADIFNVQDDTPACVKIYEYGASDTHDQIAKVNHSVKGEHIEFEWRFKLTRDPDAYPIKEQVEAYGETFEQLKFFFTVTIGSAEYGKDKQDSGFLIYPYRVADVLEFEDQLFREKSAVLMPDRADFYDLTADPGGKFITGLASVAVMLLQAVRKNAHKIMIIGHTGDGINSKLAMERAKSIAYLASGDREGFAKSANKNCTDKCIQHILKWAGFDPGEIDGKIGKNTKKQIEAFQKEEGLGADGKVGPKTWGAFYDRYEKYVEKLLCKFDDEGKQAFDNRTSLVWLDDGKQGVACAQYPTTIFESFDFRSKTNARVEVVFFNPEGTLESCPCKEKKCKPESCLVYHRLKGYRRQHVDPLSEEFQPPFSHLFSD